MTGLLHRYEALVATGELRTDPDQGAAAERLDKLQRELEKANASAVDFQSNSARSPERRCFAGRSSPS